MSHHESVLLARLLARAGYRNPHTGAPFTEAMACGLGGGIGFLYTIFEYRGVPPILTIVAQHHPQPWVPAALDRLGIGYAEERGAAKPALAALLRHLDDGRAVYCSLARPDFPTEARTVLVVGRSGDDAVLVHGGAVPVDGVAGEPQPVPVADFLAAWSAYRKGRHHRIVLEPPAGEPDLARAVRAALATTVAHLTGPVLGTGFDVNFGFSGMRRLTGQLHDVRGRAGWVVRFAAPEPFAYAVRRLYLCLEQEYTSEGATRPLYAEFLDEAAGPLEDSRLVAAAGLVRESGRNWAELAHQARAVAAGLNGLPEAAETRAMAALAGRPVPDLPAAAAPLLPDLPALFGEWAMLVEAARALEEGAVALLA